jgi:hypothetical protein
MAYDHYSGYEAPSGGTQSCCSPAFLHLNLNREGFAPSGGTCPSIAEILRWAA